jgi:hypothetical protein
MRDSARLRELLGVADQHPGSGRVRDGQDIG